MQNAIEVRDLTKQYKGFLLDSINFDVPAGYICGFIGQNGAGKTTTLRCILGMAVKDAGDIQLLNKPLEDISTKAEISVLFDQPYYQLEWTPRHVECALRPFYPNWDSAAFHGYLQKFDLDPGQKFKTLSRGMKMKLGLATALSHNARLLILDEPTSGLDPVMRDQLLDILRDYMAQDDTRSIFFSSHITTDIEKAADYLVYIHQGKILYSGLKEELLEKYCILRGGIGELPPEKQAQAIGYRTHAGGFTAMMDITHIGGLSPKILTEKATLEEIMVCFSHRTENKEGLQ
ncbi:MAG: ABC transporter ATP-binding protein [Defluviitaleaceae bacterium]|nr:ABC transporter ATP-binding protein [Defluviitaleaceae bacterium]MCL2274527.1 ABC transporter ATP-binding protein [Defluviitaleaceae bacterium]